MHHQAQRRQIDAARGDVGGDADPRPPVAQRLKCVITLRLRMFARQRHHRKAPLLQGSVKMADVVAGGAEQDRRLRLVEAQQVDDRVLDLGG